MATGDSNDIVRRLKGVIPFYWFAYVAPIRDAILGGIADGAAWCYSLITYATTQSRIATSTGPFLDLIAYDFLGRELLRGSSSDVAFRALIQAMILQERVTRAGMSQVITKLTGNTPLIIEPWNTGDVGAWGKMAWGQGRWGNMNLPGVVFMQVKRGAPSGVPGVAGWGTPRAAWGGGYFAMIGPQVPLSGVTDDDIYRAINLTKPNGVSVWVAFGTDESSSPAPPSLDLSKSEDSQYIPLL